jgi:hypothetical protein
MNKAKAAEIMEVLTNLDYFPTLNKLSDNSYYIIVADRDGVLANTLKIFQDNNAVICRAKVIDIT